MSEGNLCLPEFKIGYEDHQNGWLVTDNRYANMGVSKEAHRHWFMGWCQANEDHGGSQSQEESLLTAKCEDWLVRKHVRADGSPITPQDAKQFVSSLSFEEKSFMQYLYEELPVRELVG